EFQRISMNYYLALRDRMMALVCTPEYDHLPPPLSLSSRHMNLAVMPTPEGYLRWKDRAGRPFFTLVGFNSEGVHYTFDLDQLAKIVLYFSQLGMQNSVLGIAVDHAYCIHWRTLLGHALTQGLAPAGQARGHFARLLALIIARPGLYQEAIADYNAANPLTLFSPMSWTDIQLRTPHFNATVAVNMIRLHALLAREHNQGHIYAEKGLYYPIEMDHPIGMDPNRKHLWQQLARHGPPPVTPENQSATPHASIASTPRADEPSTSLVNVDTEMRIDLASELACPPSA
ncbi:hypothetical protein C0992_006395, partial [Termitomyces sp. T32_za158]